MDRAEKKDNECAKEKSAAPQIAINCELSTAATRYFATQSGPCINLRITRGCRQGCQIFLDTIYQKGGKHNRLPQHYQHWHKV
jgi:hypothetical protein